MFRASIGLDLPNAHREFDAFVLRWLTRVFVGEEAAKQRLAGEALVILRGVVEALDTAGFSSGLSLSARGKPAFVDRVGERDDLLAGLETALDNPQFRARPIDVQVVAAREAADLHSVAEMSMREAVLVGERELELDVSTRIRELRITGDETPRAYGDRVRQYVADGGFDRAYAESVRVVESLATRLTATTSAKDVRTTIARPRLVVPGATQVGRLRLLGFGDRLRPPAYSPLRRRQRRDAYDDPQVYYYYDPYHDLLSWLLVGEIAAGRWLPPEIDLVAVDGTVLGSAERGLPAEATEVPLDAVTLRDDGLDVDRRVPVVYTLDSAEAGSPYSPGWGGGNDGS